MTIAKHQIVQNASFAGLFGQFAPTGCRMNPANHITGFSNCRRTARLRAIDHIRKKSRFNAAIADLDQANVMSQWTELKASKRAELQQVIRDVVSVLPTRQQLVLQVYIDKFPETRSTAKLQSELSLVTGTQVTRKSVLRALEEGRKKIRSYLQRKGFFSPDA